LLHGHGIRVEFLNFDLKKVKVHCPMNAMEAHDRRRGIAPVVLNLGRRARSVVNFMPWLLFSLGKNSRCSLNRKMGGCKS